MTGPDEIKCAAEVLKKGGLVIMPTDTVYGVAAAPCIDAAVERLYEAKGRDKSNPLPLLAADIGAVEEYGAEFGELERKLAEKYWPGPLTIVLKVNQAREEGFRVPDCDMARGLLREAGGVLRVTSANLSGDDPALTAQSAGEALGGAVEFVLDGGPSPGGTSSSVVKVEDGKIKILREGAVSERELLSVIS